MTDAKPLTPLDVAGTETYYRGAYLPNVREDILRLLATIADRDKTIAERDDEIRRLRNGSEPRTGQKTVCVACGQQISLSLDRWIYVDLESGAKAHIKCTEKR